ARRARRRRGPAGRAGAPARRRGAAAAAGSGRPYARARAALVGGGDDSDARGVRRRALPRLTRSAARPGLAGPDGVGADPEARLRVHDAFLHVTLLRELAPEARDALGPRSRALRD